MKRLINGRAGRIAVVCGLAASGWIVAASASAGEDWKKWGGPNADFTVDVKGLAKKWPQEGAPKLWERELGDGYSSITSDGRTLYTMYWAPDESAADAEGKDEEAAKRAGSEVVVALDAATGKTVWEYRYPASWSADMDLRFGPGPNSTPLIVGDRLFTVGATAKMACLDRQTGRKIWEHDLVKELGAATMHYGYGASHVSYKDKVILPIGGEGRGLVAFRMSDGEVAWKRHDFAPAWATPLLIDLDGEDQLVVVLQHGVAGLNPDNGDLIWRHDGHQGSYISTPIWGDDNILFVSGAYGVGARGIKLTRSDGKTNAEELWYNPKMKVMHGSAVRVGDVVYGSSGDFGPTFIGAIDVKTGEMLWRKRGFSKANCIWTGERLIILDEDGNLALAKPTPDKLKVRSKCAVCTRNSWTSPTLIRDRLYLRDRRNIMALDLSEPKDTP